MAETLRKRILWIDILAIIVGGRVDLRENAGKSIAQILVFEGGYVNDPDDPGGETNFGISKRAFPKEDIRNMTPARASEIYLNKYWIPIHGDDLPDKLDLCVMNCAVNSGVGTALKLLKAMSDSDPDTYLFLQERYYLEITKTRISLRKYLWSWFYRTCELRRIIWAT